MAAQFGKAERSNEVLRRMTFGAGALILEPWALSKYKPPQPEESWSPFEGAREANREQLSKRAIRKMRRANKRLNHEALNTLGIVPKDHVLEIGYGSGDALVHAAKMARAGFAAGIDRSMDMLEAGHARMKKAALKNASVLRGDVSWMPWSSCSFDKALVVDGITEWPCTRSGLEEVFRVLKPGGMLVIAERISSRFTKSKALALAHLLSVVGFEDLEVRLHSDYGSELLLLRAVRN